MENPNFHSMRKKNLEPENLWKIVEKMEKGWNWPPKKPPLSPLNATDINIPSLTKETIAK